jgi:D-alanine-D-alanine ligase
MRITILLGGASAERDVSLASGLRIASALRDRGHGVILVDPASGVISSQSEMEMREGGVLKPAPPSLESLKQISEGALLPTLGVMPEVREADVVFLALHGGEGEDGTLQAMLDLARVRYTGSGHLGSALAMDKDLSKILFRAAGVGTADWIMTGSRASAAVKDGAIAATLGFPVVVKPSKQGSTVGLSVVREPSALRPAITEALAYDDEVMIERFVPGRELTVAILGGEALPVGEIIPKHEIYDYECKYTAGMAREEFPAKLTPAIASEAQRQARLAFDALKLDGYARIDFRLTDAGQLSCLEANTLPGMTEFSLVPQAAAAAGIDFGALCERIVELALAKPRGGG